MTVRTATYVVGDVVEVSADASGEYKARRGIITEVGPGEREYRIEFEDGERPTTGYLPLAWLSRRTPEGAHGTN
jgi:hypothetical protein